MPESAIDEVPSSEKKFITTVDPDDSDYQKQLLRPAAVKEDVFLMSQRKRVSMILKSEPFRKELEEITRSQSQAGDYPGISTSLLSLQHISELFCSPPIGQNTGVVGLGKGHKGGVIPVNDLRGGDAAVYSRYERTLRCKLAAVYRLMDLFGWNISIHNHVTARISRNHEHFLINPYGLLYHEITASSLIKVDYQGQILDSGSTVLGINQNTWMLHSAVHTARADIRCIIHIDTPATIAVSCMKSGLLPLCNEAMILGEVAYYTPSGPFSVINNGEPAWTSAGDQERLKDWTTERVAVAEALGPTARVFFLRSRGLLALGETVEEAWHYAMNAVVACDTQLLLASLGVENLVIPNEKQKQKTYEVWRTSDLGGLSGPEAALAMRLAAASAGKTATGSSTEQPVGMSRPWRLGELEFEAMMRHLDNAGCRTGHFYRKEALESPRKGRTLDGYTDEDEVQIPPAASSATATMAYFCEDGMFSGDETETPRPSTLRRDWYEKEWLNTPNKYTKELLKPSPGHRPVSHWVSDRENAIRDAINSGTLPPPAPFHPLTPGAVPLGTTGGPATGTALTYYGAFAPQGANPKEYRDQQRRVKDKYYHDTNTAGPQSRLLDGLTWDEARRVRDEGLVKVFGPKTAALVAQGANLEAPVAAASKAIIHRDLRDAAVIYDGLYTHQNPFEKITDAELEMYKREIELKNNPELAAQMARALEEGNELHLQSPPRVESLAVDSGATDLESASEAGVGFESRTGFVPQWSPTLSDADERATGTVDSARLHLPVTSGTLTSEPSELDDADPEKKQKQKKKKRFNLPSFSLRVKDKSKAK